MLEFTELKDSTRTVQTCRDPNDNHVLEIAASVNAKFIITADPDLLALGQFEQTRIVTVASFLKLLDPI